MAIKGRHSKKRDAEFKGTATPAERCAWGKVKFRHR